MTPEADAAFTGNVFYFCCHPDKLIVDFMELMDFVQQRHFVT